MSDDKENEKFKQANDNKKDFPPLSRIGPIEEIGSQIGQYKLLSILGEGGFGIVYLAKQKGPIGLYVALKVIKPGMDTKQVIARFEQERQTLALLDHPSIAHVYDGGTTESGRPYFVMEFVKGLPITEYCNQETLKLKIEERLKLFHQVCEAIQYAHQKGIIHRDIKPSNILVSVKDGKAVPKIIDFGVAKAISQHLSESTLYTKKGELIGTPEYMSPEQAEMSGLDIDTRSDIYSLGIVLYELLTGALPFSHDTFERAGPAEIQRIIREFDPPRPSIRLLSLGEKAKTIAEKRSTKIDVLIKRLKKELEWIPLKAMRKEPGRRYQTASELADDVSNYLNGDVLIAGPESTIYQLKKAIKRNRVAVTGIAAVLLGLLVGFIVSTVLYLEAEKQRDLAEERRIEAEQVRDELEIALEKVAEAKKIAEIERDASRLAHEKESVALAEAKSILTLLNSANRLDLSDFPSSDMHLEYLTDIGVLESLDLQNTQITDLELVNLKDIASLKSLLLGGTAITDTGMINLSNLKNLQTLCVHKTKITSAGLEYIKDLKTLQALCFHNTQVGDSGLVHIKDLTKLKSLKIYYTPITDTGLEYLKNLNLLVYLDLEGTNITDAGLKHIRNLHLLEYLHLSRTKIDDSGLEYLKDMRYLGRLYLGGTNITDSGLSHLKNLNRLRILDIRNTRISDDGLANLKYLTSLRALYLEGTGITEAGLKDLRLSLPNCRMFGPASPTLAQHNTQPVGAEQIATLFDIPEEKLKIPEELQPCVEHLKQIYAAIKQYEKDHGILPDNFDDLIPKYVKREILWCPIASDTSDKDTSDANSSDSYGYEYSSLRISNEWPIIGGMTFHDWKKQQEKLFGDVVPLVRCYKHGPDFLTISISGKVYLSPGVWERMFISDYTHGDEFRRDSSKISNDTSANQVAPSFTLKDINGESISLSDFRGKVVLLDFWATWCGPCRTAIPYIEALYQKYKDQGLVVIGMNDEADHDKVKEFAKNRMSYTILLDADEQFQKYRINGIPTVYYINREGNIHYRDVGFSPGKEKDIEQKIKELLDKKAEGETIHSLPDRRESTTSAPENDTILLSSDGQINGQLIDRTHYKIEVQPGALLTGNINIRVYNAHSPGAIVPAAATFTWGNRETQSWLITGHITPGWHDLTVDITGQKERAPTTPGIYYIIISASGEFTAEQIMSGTNWAYQRDKGKVVWLDDNDRGWDWSEQQFQEARDLGQVTCMTLKSTGDYTEGKIGANWIEVKVINTQKGSVELPDLIVSKIEIPSAIIKYSEQPWTWATFTIKNIGSGEVPEVPIHCNIVNAKFNNLPLNHGGYFDISYIPPLAVNQEVIHRFAVGHDSLWPAGKYTLQVKVDYTNQIKESNELNNISSTVSFTVVDKM